MRVPGQKEARELTIRFLIMPLNWGNREIVELWGFELRPLACHEARGQPLISPNVA
jgi:hypothetical protein